MALKDAARDVDGAFTRDEWRGQSFENAFGGALSFLRRRYAKDVTGADVAVLGVPFDQAVTNRPGCRLGPRAIREASSLMVFDPPFGWGFDPLRDFAIADAGDLAFDYARVADFPAALETEAARLLAQAPGLVALGGDHSISLPLLRAAVAREGRPLALLQFDAHSDTWPDDDATRIDHGTMFGKAVTEGLIDVERSVQVGIRTVNPDTRGIATIDAREVARHGPDETAARIRERLGDAPVYLSFDIDALDPAHAPGTGTPVWGGLSSVACAIILRELAGIRLVAGDVVEVSPPFDAGGITALAGAHVAYDILCLWCWTRRGDADRRNRA